MKNLRKHKKAGSFTLPTGKDVYGELTLAGGKTSLHLQNKDYFDTHSISGHFIKGILHDFTKVTLLQCLTPPAPGSFSRGEKGYHFAKIFPHFIVYGDQHVDPTEKQITAVNFVIDDAATLFYDFDAFGSLIDARPFIEQIVHAQGLSREIAIGPDPQILYFTGKREIFATNTVMGKISASHCPSHDLGGPRGVSLDNTIYLSLVFEEAIDFEDSIARTCTLLRYLGMLVGRPQNLLKLYLNIVSDDKQSAPLEVYWSLPPKRGSSNETEKPHPGDLLLDAVRQPVEFSRVLGSWLERQKVWHDARLRFFNSFAKQHYSIERLIGSANMFDILPSSAVPSKMQLSEELKLAKEQCRTIFKNLPKSLERDSVLNALGRVGKSALKHKIRHRGQLLIDRVEEKFPALFTITDEAVNCRNHYVHGSEPSFDYNDNFDAVVFFTDTLEFVFAASDLIEAGWDIKSWSEIPKGMSHPFGLFCANYSENLRMFRKL